MQLSTWLTVGSGVVILSVAGFSLLRQTPAPVNAEPDRYSVALDAAVNSEAQRILSFAATDPECAGLPEQNVCFLGRLETENRDAIAKQMFRQKALQRAREIASGN